VGRGEGGGKHKLNEVQIGKSSRFPTSSLLQEEEKRRKMPNGRKEKGRKVGRKSSSSR